MIKVIYRMFYYLKKKIHFIWLIFSYINTSLFYIFYPKIKSKIKLFINYFDVNNLIKEPDFLIRFLSKDDFILLESFLNREENQSAYFKPFAFSKKKIKYILSSPSFINLGIFYNQKIIGYFFLRLFINRKSFLGLIVDFDFRGKGFSKVMLNVLYNLAKHIKFELYSTIWKKNISSFNAHDKNYYMQKIYENVDFCTFKILGVKKR